MNPLDFTCPWCLMPGGVGCVTRARYTAPTHKARGRGILVRVKGDPKDIGVFRGREVYWPDNVDTVVLSGGQMFDSAGTELEIVPATP